MRSNIFGRRLSSQITWPLVIAAAIIGLVATLVSLSVLNNVTDSWADEAAHSAADHALSHIITCYESEYRALDLLSVGPGFKADVAEGNPADLKAQLESANEAIRADALVLVDADGLIVAATESFERFDDASEYPTAASSAPGVSPTIVQLGGDCVLWTSVPLDLVGREGWSLGGLLEIDDELIASLDIGAGAGAVIVDSAGAVIASVRPGSDLGGMEVTPEIRRAFESAVDALLDDPETSVSCSVDEGDFRLAAIALDLANRPSEVLYAIAIVDVSETRSASAATAHFIASWSIVAIALLASLNWWVVRSVVTPLRALTVGARRLAEGDFDSKIEVSGSNEVSELAENFNRMTDALGERSEALTKKVLELATLYEMSRSLGSTLEQEALLDSVLDSALRIFDVEIGYVTMVDHDTGELSLRAWRGTDLSRTDDGAVRNSMSEWVIREGRPLIFNPQSDSDGEARDDGVAGALAALCVPLLSPEGTIGSMTVGSRDPDRRFSSEDVRLLATIANHVTMAIGNIGLFSSVQEAYLATVRALAAAVDAKDPYTRGHSEGVAKFALQIGEAMDFSSEQMIALEMAAYLHDIGKIGISEDILLKPGKLTDGEMSQMRHHPLIGANILKPVAFPWPIAPIVRHHHEHFDGDGYPAGLRGEEIPILARVLTVADAYEAMVADRPYRRGRSQQEAMLELRRCAGTQFDPQVVGAFIEVLEALGIDTVELREVDDEIGADEAQAVYIAVCDGMFSSFRKLGGPRLANNLERSVNERLRLEEIPLVLQAGRLLAADGEIAGEAVTEHLARALTMMSEGIESASGVGLVDHFLAEALETLPERMRVYARKLGFSPSS